MSLEKQEKEKAALFEAIAVLGVNSTLEVAEKSGTDQLATLLEMRAQSVAMIKVIDRLIEEYKGQLNG